MDSTVREGVYQMRKGEFYKVLLAGAVAGALNFAIPASAAIIDSEAAQVDTVDVAADFFVKLQGIDCPGRPDGFFRVPATNSEPKLSAILTAIERLYIVAFRFDTANCNVQRVFVCPRSTGRCDA